MIIKEYCFYNLKKFRIGVSEGELSLLLVPDMVDNPKHWTWKVDSLKISMQITLSMLFHVSESQILYYSCCLLLDLFMCEAVIDRAVVLPGVSRGRGQLHCECQSLSSPYRQLLLLPLTVPNTLTATHTHTHANTH